jgi:hypothetical protein
MHASHHAIRIQQLRTSLAQKVGLAQTEIQMILGLGILARTPEHKQILGGAFRWPLPQHQKGLV